MKLVNDFFEYKILAMNDKNKIEDWNGIVLKRPDPQIIWNDEENIKNSCLFHWNYDISIYCIGI